MTAPVAEQNIDALLTLLTGLATTGSNVSREPARPSLTLPCIVIKEPDGDGGTETPTTFPAPCVLECEQQIELEIRVKDVTDSAGTRSTIRGEIEAAVSGNRTLGGLCKDVRPRRHQPWRTAESTHLDKPVAVGVLTLRAIYFVREDARHVPL